MCDEKQNECRDHGDPPWEGPQVIPAQIRRVDNLIFRKINQFARANGVEQATPMHGWIIEYLYRHREEQVFQRDIEREFSITRSTVTNILQLMERKGYIQRQSVPQDARLKQLVLTEEVYFLRKPVLPLIHRLQLFAIRTQALNRRYLYFALFVRIFFLMTLSKRQILQQKWLFRTVI